MIALLEARNAGLLARKQWLPNVVAGIVVAVVAVPLSMAFAIASGARPEQGLYTAIIGGGLVSMFGGSRLQIAGPTGAFIAVLAGMRPPVALTLVEMGKDLIEMETAFDLEGGVAKIARMMADAPVGRRCETPENSPSRCGALRRKTVRMQAFREGCEAARTWNHGRDERRHERAAAIGAPGFEPGTSCSQSRRATRLRYAPKPRGFRREAG